MTTLPTLVEKHDPIRIRNQWRVVWTLHYPDGIGAGTGTLYFGLTRQNRPSRIRVRLVRRDLAGNETGEGRTFITDYAVAPTGRRWNVPYSFQLATRADTPLTLEVTHDGAGPIVLGNRVLHRSVDVEQP